MASRGARVSRVDVAIGETVERHRGAAGEDHAQQDAERGPATGNGSSAHASAAARSANGSAKSVWLKRMSSSNLRVAEGMMGKV